MKMDPVILSAHRLPEKWTVPLHHPLYSFIAGFRETSISEIAQRTALIAKTILSAL